MQKSETKLLLEETQSYHSYLIISDLFGRKIKEVKLSNSEQIIETGNINPGIYVVNIFSTSGDF